MQQKVRRIAALWTAVLLFEAPLALAQVNSGSIVGWGARVVGNGSSLSGTIAVAAGRFRSVALQADGSVLTWGSNADGQCLVPLPNVDFTAVAGGGEHNLGLRSDGTIVTWGNNEYGQCDVPAPNTGVDCRSARLAGRGLQVRTIARTGALVRPLAPRPRRRRIYSRGGRCAGNKCAGPAVLHDRPMTGAAREQ